MRMEYSARAIASGPLLQAEFVREFQDIEFTVFVWIDTVAKFRFFFVQTLLYGPGLRFAGC